MKVDLRSDYERTYNQGPDNACGPFAACAALDSMWERAIGKPTRFDPYHLWDWVRFYRGMVGTNTGSDFPSLERAIRFNGMRLGDQTIRGFELRRTLIATPQYTDLKHLLSMGVPVIWEMKVTQDLYALADKRDWRTHNVSQDTSTTHGQHYVCLVGFDDDAGRWLVENSWGPAWADGGFFGVPYTSFQVLTESVQHFHATPINPKPVEGYSVPAHLTTQERAAFADRAAAKLLETLMAAFEAGPQSLLDACKAWGVSDKHLESLAGWHRGRVREIRAEYSDLNWSGFVFDQQ